jgi:heme exporter protein D
MGKYAVYVWSAYGASLLVLAALVWDSLARARRWRRAAQDAEHKDAERKDGAQP